MATIIFVIVITTITTLVCAWGLFFVACEFYIDLWKHPTIEKIYNAIYERRG